MPLKNFMLYHRCLFLFKLILLEKPNPYEKLEFVQSPRLPFILIIPMHGTSGSKSFFVRDISFWNKIPNAVKVQNSVVTYKTESKKYFKRPDLNLT